MLCAALGGSVISEQRAGTVCEVPVPLNRPAEPTAVQTRPRSIRTLVGTISRVAFSHLKLTMDNPHGSWTHGPDSASRAVGRPIITPRATLPRALPSQVEGRRSLDFGISQHGGIASIDRSLDQGVQLRSASSRNRKSHFAKPFWLSEVCSKTTF
jgi:hypothetical protein